MIEEDRLLSRIDVLEKQLILSTKNINEETFKKSINMLRDEKFTIESSAKVSKKILFE